MKWAWCAASDKSAVWQESAISWGDAKHAIVFVVEEHRRCWRALYMVGEQEIMVGDYKSERYAKAACRRKAGAMVAHMRRDIQA